MFNENRRNSFEGGNEREKSLKEIKSILESLGAKESVIKNILECLRKFSDYDFSRFISGGELFLKTRLNEILESIKMEKGPESSPGKIERIMRNYTTKEDENVDEGEKKESKIKFTQDDPGFIIEVPDMEGLDNIISKSFRQRSKTTTNTKTDDNKADDDKDDDEEDKKETNL